MSDSGARGDAVRTGRPACCLDNLIVLRRVERSAGSTSARIGAANRDGLSVDIDKIEHMFDADVRRR